MRDKKESAVVLSIVVDTTHFMKEAVNNKRVYVFFKAITIVCT